MNVTKVIPFSYEDQSVRTIQVEDQPFFVAIDVCQSLGLTDTSMAVKKLDDDEKIQVPKSDLGVSAGGEMWLVNESGLYTLILRSNKPEAKAFRKWITSEVLPALRKTGHYAMPAAVSKFHEAVQDMVNRAVFVVGSREQLAKQIGVSPAMLHFVVYGNWESVSAEMFGHIWRTCHSIVNGGLAPGARVVELLMKVEDKDLRMELFSHWKNRRLQ